VFWLDRGTVPKPGVFGPPARFAILYVKSLKLVYFALLSAGLGVDRLLGSIIMPEVFAGVRPPGRHLPNLWHEGQREAVFRGLL